MADHGKDFGIQSVLESDKKDEAVKALANIVRTNVTDIIEIKGNMIQLKNLEHLPDDVLSNRIG